MSLPKISIAYAISWSEFERGWGRRPDGYSLHPSEQAAKDFVADYTKDRTGPAPDEYSAPDGPAFAVAVQDETQLDFSKNSKGIWVNHLPSGVSKL